MSNAEKPDRDFLIEEARYGRLSPAEAEAQAQLHGIAPLADRPNPDDYEVTQEPWWPLPMVLAWIIWRDANRVVDFYDPFRTKCFDWHHRKWRLGFADPVYEGHFLESRRPATLSVVKMSRWFRSSDDLTTASENTVTAEEELLRSLKEGSLAATGIPSDNDKRESIPAHDWNDLKLVEERDRDVATRSHFGSGYSNILFNSQVVMARWPKRHAVPVECSLPATIKPEGAGYFPLYCAAQWIATAGGTRQFDPEEESIWAGAFRDLLNAIASDVVVVTGICNGVRERIDAHIFASLNVDHPYSQSSVSLLLGEEMYLSSALYIDDEHWHGGWNDSLKDRNDVRWSKLMVRKSDVAQAWPFDSADIRTGGPGRPTPMHLVVEEHKRRIENRESEKSVSSEAKHLVQWLATTHPGLPRVKAGTIENNIRAAHRSAPTK